MSFDLPLRANLSIKSLYRQYLNTKEGAETYEQFKRVLYTDDDSMMGTLNANLLPHLPSNSAGVLRVCDIGGGNGRRIARILKFLHEKFDFRFELDFVEQSSPLMRGFDSREIDAFSEIKKFEMLFEDATLKTGYDLMFLIHSIFAFENSLAVDKICSLLKPGGVVLVVSNAPDSFLAGLKCVLDVGYNDSRFEITDLIKSLDDRQIPSHQIQFKTNWAIHKATLRQETEVVLNWLSLGRYKDLSDDSKNEVWRYIEENSLDMGQRVLFSESEVVVVVFA
jgi:SAM-dependent methyltransferase